MKKILTYYSFIIVTLIAVAGFLNAATVSQLIAAILFFPLTLFFWLRVFPKKQSALSLPKEILALKPITSEEIKHKKEFDMDRRTFIKLIGSAGLSLFFFSVFTKKAEAAFFGSVPGPGTVAIKDTAGTQIDPAQNHPTDGYKIAQLDDSTPAYYGFLNKTGAWFIMKEDSTTGDYRYAKGASGFSTNWTDRASLTYDYFDSVF